METEEEQTNLMTESLVALATAAPRYGEAEMARAVADLFTCWGLDKDRQGTPEWNPLGEWIPAGARVVIKPNWVLHANELPGGGMDCLITHRTLIAAVLSYVLRARPSRVVIGDAPLQGCDFARLRAEGGLDRLAEVAPGVVEIADFRRTLLRRDGHAAHRQEGVRAQENFVLYDLGADSLIEALPPDAAGRLRVTMYNPDLLARVHAPGRHCYLIAREIIDSDVVLNLPKLKSHMKAGVTGALKNLIGINGNKEFLPHHRKGGSAQGGDCYDGYSFWQSCAENLYDAANRSSGGAVQTALYWGASQSLRAARVFGSEGMVEGAWHGNQTVWRTCLDLNRVLRYGRLDGTLADTPQRRTIHITDAIIGGQGEGPLRPEPVPSGFLTGALNPAAAEWVNVLAMGWDPRRLPIVREAFGSFRWPLTGFGGDDIQVATAAGIRPAASIGPPNGEPFRASAGWRGHVEAPGERRKAG
jgi:uncharacterized protein (DUF362 family)